MIPVDITMPTTLRPSVLERTLSSFCENLFTERDRYRLIMNIDQVGEDCSPMDVVRVASEFFSSVSFRVSDSPSFPMAFKWCWMQTQTPFVFHMNEDWELRRHVDIDHMIELMAKTPTLACLRLNKMKIPLKDIEFFGCRFFLKNGCLMARHRHDQFSSNPELVRGRFIQAALRYLNDSDNPEAQFRGGSLDLWLNVSMYWDYALYAAPGDDELIVDIGKDWMEKEGMKKIGDQFSFTNWTRDEGRP